MQLLFRPDREQFLPWPKCSTFTLPFTAKRTSSTICPAFSSVTSIPFTLLAYSAIAFVGNGHRVMGRSIPTLIPSSRASSIAFWPIRAIEPKATIRYSASSQSISSKRTSFSSITLYFALSGGCFSPSLPDAAPTK